MNMQPSQFFYISYFDTSLHLFLLFSPGEEEK